MIQTYIAVFEDENKKTIDFYRFTYKKLSTVIKKLKEYFKKEYEYYKKFTHSLYKKNFDNNINICIYQTPYETNEDNKVFIQNIIEFVKN